MAPMTGGVTDGKENGLIFTTSQFKGFIAPRIPVDGVMGMLQEVGGLFMD